MNKIGYLVVLTVDSKVAYKFDIYSDMVKMVNARTFLIEKDNVIAKEGGRVTTYLFYDINNKLITSGNMRYMHWVLPGDIVEFSWEIYIQSWLKNE